MQPILRIVCVCVCLPAAECGSTVSNNEGVLLSPNYPMNYDNSHECVYSIQVQTGKGINITAGTFQLAQGDILKVTTRNHDQQVNTGLWPRTVSNH